MARIPEVEDKTARYFDRETPEYSRGRLAHVFPFIREHATAGSALLDIGCGVGNLLEEIRDRTPIQLVTGLDVSRKCLEKTQRRLGCPVLLGSVLDAGFVSRIKESFDFVLLASILHHLVGKTRRQSKRNSATAVKHAFELTRPGGYMIILEPGINPKWTGFLLFYAKRMVTKFTSGRVQLFDKWNNIGAPVISYLTHSQITSLVLKGGAYHLVEKHVEDMHVNLLWRISGITRRTNTTLILRKPAVGAVLAAAEKPRPQRSLTRI